MRVTLRECDPGAPRGGGQRFGAAIGTATLPALFYLVLSSTGNDFRAAVAAALATSVVGVAAALVIAVVEWRRDVRQERRAAEQHPAEQHL